MKKPFEWDSYSDQPYPLKDKVFKKELRKKEFASMVKTALISMAIVPFSLLLAPFLPKKEISLDEFFCIGVDYQRDKIQTLDYIRSLGVKRVLLRFKLWEMDTIDELRDFMIRCNGAKITLKIIQDREHVDDEALLKRDLKTIFKKVGEFVDMFEIGTTINRTKWGFFSVDEYNRFYKTAYEIKALTPTAIKLIGSGIIDFEYHFSAHTLFNFYNYRYDGISALLYVDRRGAPENRQMGFSLLTKISLLYSMLFLSPKTKNELHITETNWPISNTAPYAPTSEFECVSEELYADYMLRYYLLGIASQKVNSISWHQLIASGYGLIDARDGLRERSAYHIYGFMIKMLQDAKFLKFVVHGDRHELHLLKDNKQLEVHWSLKPTTLKKTKNSLVYASDGKLIEDEMLQVASSPIYIQKV